MTTPPDTIIRSRLHLPGTAFPPFTSRCETDTRLAITRGIAEYLEDVSIVAFGGRKVRFKAVHEEFAEPEETATYPAARVAPGGQGVYEARSLTPVLDPACRLPAPDGRYLLVPADFVQPLLVEGWTNDPEERTALIQALEAALFPNAQTASFNLILPHYYNVPATCALTGLTIEDDGDASKKRFRNFTFSLTARVPLVRLVTFPDGRPSFDLQAVGTGADVLVTLEVT